MNADLIFDPLLAALVLFAAISAVAARRTFAGVVGFVSYGLALSLVWVRLAAVDVALTEAAIGALTGALLLAAAARLRASEGLSESERAGRALRAVAALLCAAVSAALAAAGLSLPESAPSLAPAAAASLPQTGVGNPVTAALMAWRAIDTLLEKIVVLMALLAVWSLARDGAWGGRPGDAPSARRDDALVFLARMLPPLGIVVGVYLVWNSADEPGGAFQGGALLAAMWLLARMAGLVDAPRIGARGLRLLLVSGPLAFLAVGLAGFAWAGGFLAYPEGWEKPLILLVEAPMLLMIAAVLALLIDGPPTRTDDR
ncbi:MAG TPA: MnhB domain-containing protein [Myxococcota bacterium]|nr:MnhB domain-containing protein [Myxococcota bacterium]